jgi:predicted AAA+ superfamily ATPase
MEVSMPQYRPRIVDDELANRLASMGAVVIEGPKACGKTETARQVAASEVLLDIDEAAKQAAAVDPGLVLEGETPRLIDEWQIEPRIWDRVRREVDDREGPGQFILTGSAVPADDSTRHTGAGRITRLRMRPMSLFEVGRSDGQISLAHLLEGEEARSADVGLSVSDLAQEIAVGGWPGLRGSEPDRALRAVRDYLEEIRRLDIRRVDGVRRDPNKVGQLLRSLARNVATYATAATLANDTREAGGSVERHSVTDYLDALDRLMIVEDQPAWAPHLRSRYVLRSAPKRHFVDPSLAAAALRATPPRLMQDLNLLGFLFESMVVRDLRVYAQASDAQVLQYRDSNGLEVDAVVEAADGRWAAFEIKLGPGQIDEAAENLIKFNRQIDTAKCGEPAVLAVIVGTGYGYLRDDGIQVLPIGSLRH